MSNEEKKNLVEKYVSDLQGEHKTGHALEHAYRPALKGLFELLDPSIKAVNDPKQSEHGAPDFIFVKGDVIAGYAEAKDITVDLDKIKGSEQLERYFGYSNLILTNYLEFHFFKNGEPYGQVISIGKIIGGELISDEESFSLLGDALTDFLKSKPEPIKSGEKLSKIMAGKARRIRDNVNRFLSSESGNVQALLALFFIIKKCAYLWQKQYKKRGGDGLNQSLTTK